MINKYTKKPITIEALQWDGTWETSQEVINFTEGNAFISDALDFKRQYLRIETPEGVMTVSPKDYVIKGVKGEFYPCKTDIFCASYIPSSPGKNYIPTKPCTECGKACAMLQGSPPPTCDMCRRKKRE